MFLLQTKQGVEDWQIPIEPGELTLIGRGDHCAVQLEDPSISRVHCRVLLRKGIVRLYDAGSRWGTFVNGERVGDCLLKQDDEIEIGETKLKFVIENLKEPVLQVESISKKESQSNEDQQSAVDLKKYHDPEVFQSLSGLENYVGKPFLGYEIERIISRTQRGVVYQATDTENNTAVAIKIFHRHLFEAEEEQKRFQRASNTMLELDHDNVVTLLAAGNHRKLFYTVSEFVEGESVHQMISRIGIAGMLDWKRVLQIGIDIAEALSYLDENNVVHRNILPSNIFVRIKDDRAMLGDVTLAKPLCGDHAEPITEAEKTVGELVYLSPEEIESNHLIDGRTDLYHLGVMFYKLLTGDHPFEGKTAPETLSKILDNKLVSPKSKNLGIPDLLEGILLRMISKRREDRHENAQELLEDFKRVLRYTN